jgi:3'-phosphoadenosine 5'-phosphosulfate sulfotransferase
LAENGIQLCGVGVKFRGTVTAKCDGRLELAVVFDKGRNLRVERRASITGSDRRRVRVGVNFCNSVVVASAGARLGRVSQNEARDGFALLLGQGCRVDADLHTHDVRFSES